MRTESPPWAAQAMSHLKAIDPVIARVIDQVGPLTLTRRPERFPALARAIIFQQLAGAAALAIYRRVVKQIGGGRFPTPAMMLKASDEMMRAAGLSRGKMAYLRDLAVHVRDGALNFHRFARMADDEIIAELTRVKGIGRWTAEMFLMFNLRRPDILPVGDLGFRNAVAKLYRMRNPPTPKELADFGERWRPYRSAAVWYLWQSTRLITPDDATPARTIRVTKKAVIKRTPARGARKRVAN